MRHLLTRLRRNGHAGGAAMIACMLGAFAVGLSDASASRTSNVPFTLAEHGPYACLGPCATAVDFVVTGTAVSEALGTMTVLGIGHVIGKPDAKNCIPQSERWAFTSKANKGQDSIEATTKGDKICFNKDYSAAVETGVLTITGGTGKYKGATGSGRLKFNVLSSPQKGGGSITGMLNLP